jgi:hypothetical protein
MTKKLKDKWEKLKDGFNFFVGLMIIVGFISLISIFWTLYFIYDLGITLFN